MLKLCSQQSRVLVRRLFVYKSVIDKGAKNIKVDSFIINSIKFVLTVNLIFFFHVLRIPAHIVELTLKPRQPHLVE